MHTKVSQTYLDTQGHVCTPAYCCHACVLTHTQQRQLCTHVPSQPGTQNLPNILSMCTHTRMGMQSCGQTVQYPEQVQLGRQSPAGQTRAEEDVAWLSGSQCLGSPPHPHPHPPHLGPGPIQQPSCRRSPLTLLFDLSLHPCWSQTHSFSHSPALIKHQLCPRLGARLWQ